MVSENQKVILIEANETTGSSSASITWKLVEEKKQISYRNKVYLKNRPSAILWLTLLAAEQL